MRNKKGNIVVIFLAVVLFASVSVTGYLFWQNKQLQNQKVESVPQVQTPAPVIDPTTDWKTYTSQKYKFSFQYPTGYEIKEAELSFNNEKFPSLQIIDPVAKLRLTAYMKIEYGLTELGFKPSDYISVSNNTNLIRVVSYFESQWTYFQKQNGGECYYGNGKIKDGENGVKCYNVNFPFNWSFELLAVNGMPFDKITQTEEQFQIFDQILSTFKFL